MTTTFLRAPHRVPFTVMAAESGVSETARRILLLIAETAGGHQGDFAKRIGMSSSTLSRILSGKQPAQDEHLRLIEEKTAARFEWLKTGELPIRWPGDRIPERPEVQSEGEMLRRYLDRNGWSQVRLADRLNKATTTVNQYLKSKTIDAENKKMLLVALGAQYDDVFGKAGAGPTPPRRLVPVRLDESELNLATVLRIPIRARAGFGYEAYFSGQDADQEYLSIPAYKLYPGIKPEKHVIVEVNGDSMQPQLEPGFEMLAYELEKGKFPPLDKIVLVDFRDELTIKRLVAVDWVDKNVTLRSDNGGAEMRIAMQEIRKIWRVYDYYKARL